MKKEEVFDKEQAQAEIAQYITENEETGCHEWTYTVTRDGYPQLCGVAIFNGVRIKSAHRLAYAAANDHTFTGRGQQVRHSCHNRRCCNPDHFSIGTAMDNLKDAQERLIRVGDARYVRADATIDQVRKIKRLLSETKMTRTEIAKAVKSTYGIVYAIDIGLTWTWLDSEHDLSA